MVGGAVQYKVIIRIDIDEAKDRLDNMLDRMNDFSPILRHAGEKLERVYSENFTTMGAMSAKAMLRGAWPPLDPQYAAWKAMRYPGAPPLVQTGELFRSVSNLTKGPVNSISDHEAVFGVVGKIPKFHQYGTENMPARKIIFVPKDFDRDMGKAVARYVTEGSKII
jgi:phage gpG-like protein